MRRLVRAISSGSTLFAFFFISSPCLTFCFRFCLRDIPNWDNVTFNFTDGRVHFRNSGVKGLISESAILIQIVRFTLPFTWEPWRSSVSFCNKWKCSLQCFYPFMFHVMLDNGCDSWRYTVDSRYLEFQETHWNTSRYPYLDISELREWVKQYKIMWKRGEIAP